MRLQLYCLIITVLIFHSVCQCQRPEIDSVIVSGYFKDAVAFSIDPDCNFYVVDGKTSQLLKISPEGKLLQTTGGYGWSSLVFDQPMDVVSPNGIDVYVADYGNHRIIRFDRNLNFVSSLYSSDENNSLRFGYPRSVAISRLGELFLVDGENVRVVKISKSNKYDRSFGGRDAGDGKLNDPYRLRISSSDFVYCKDDNCLKVFDTFGNYLRTVGEGVFRKLITFTIEQNHLFALDSGLIYHMDEKGIIISKFNLSFKSEEYGSNRVVDIAFWRNTLYFLTPGNITAKKFPLIDELQK